MDTNRIAEMEGLNPNDLVQAIHIRFLPDSSKLDNISGPAFKEACSLELRNIVNSEKVSINGKLKTVQTLKPIATAVAELRAGTVTPTPGGNGGNSGGGGDNGGDDGLDI